MANALMEQGAGGVIEMGDDETMAYFAMDEPSFRHILEKVKEFLKRLPEFGLDPGPATVTWRVVSESSWADAWKEFFHPQHIGEKIVIRPSWRQYQPKPHEIVIDLDPGMAFGTGLHPTTRLCIRYLEQVVRPGVTVFDIGTGSGILSVVAAKLGANRVVAVDVDPMAVRVSADNASSNGVSSIVTTKKGSWQALTGDGQADVVVANILAEVIIDMAEDVKSLVAPGGEWIASGIIADKEKDVSQALHRHGWEITNILRDGDWIALRARPAVFH